MTSQQRAALCAMQKHNNMRKDSKLGGPTVVGLCFIQHAIFQIAEKMPELPQSEIKGLDR